MNKKYFWIFMGLSAIYIINRVVRIETCYFNDFISGIWLMSCIKMYFETIDNKILLTLVVIMAFCSEYLSPLIKPTTYDILDIPVILLGGIIFYIIMEVNE